MNHQIIPAKEHREIAVEEIMAAVQILPPPLERNKHAITAQRAYSLYIQSGCLPDRCQQNWYQAEQLLEAEALTVRSRIDNGSAEAPAPFETPTPTLRTSRPTTAIRNGKRQARQSQSFPR